MRRYWWVNHKQTVRQEIGGRFLWSPKTEANGSRSQFYDNMLEASPGDLVLSYANTEIGFIGIVSDYAVGAPKPDEFGQTGLNWSTIGWLLPVTWQKIALPVHPKSILSTIAPLLPKKYSPLNPTNGNGNQKAYLAEISEALFDAIILDSNAKSMELPTYRSLASDFLDNAETAVQKAVENDVALSDTEKDQVIKARKGQGNFRDDLFEVERCCRLTGITNPGLLIASHIKPWRWCTSAAERLDRFNGLLLTPHVDRLFDRGFMSFLDDGGVIISPHLPHDDLVKLGLHERCKVRVGDFRPEQRAYLAYHREEILLD